jgi:hypothetical protein
MTHSLLKCNNLVDCAYNFELTGKPSAEPTANEKPRSQKQVSKTAPIRQQVIEQQRWGWEEPKQPLQQIREPEAPTKSVRSSRVQQRRESGGNSWTETREWRASGDWNPQPAATWNVESNQDTSSTRGGAVGRRASNQDAGNRSFSCNSQHFATGLYADEPSDCVMYHQCLNGQKSTFRCGSGQRFDQHSLTCMPQHKVNCADSAKHYEQNSRFN